MLKLENISKKYNNKNKKVEVLKDVNYEFLNNKVYCIIGRSGTGKSTLIEIMGLLLNYETGNIIINNKKIKEKNEKEKAKIRNKEIGFVFQNYYLNPLMKAYENVMLPTYVNDLINEKDRKAKAYKLLDEVGLKGREAHFPKELSGGEQQRVAIARALVNNPNIILADEPSGALDPENEENILKILKELAEKGKCVIVVSHSKNVLKYADVILKIESHKLIEVQHEELI